MSDDKHAHPGEQSRGTDVGEDDSDVVVVDWDGPNDPENPKNWSYEKRWRATIAVSLFTFASTVTSSGIAPGSSKIAEEFGITSQPIVAMTVSIFVLAYAIGPLFMAPLSEIYGRTKVIQLSNLFFFAWNMACGFAQNKTQLIIFRFLAGLGGSPPLAVGMGVLGDMWRAEERGRASATYSLAPLMGPVIGPVIGAWISARTTWRWVFWSTCIFAMAVQVMGLFFLRETFAPVLLEQKIARLRKAEEPEKGARRYRTVFEASETRSWQHIFSKALRRPFALFMHESIVQLLGLYMAFIYGIFYIYLTTIPTIFRDVYHHPPGVAGLHYFALGIGLIFTSQLNSRTMDTVYIYLRDRNGGIGEPEFRIPSMFPASVLFPIGLLVSGWAAEKQLHWIVVDVGMALVGAGMILSFQSIQTYLVDTFTLFSASALAAVTFIRSVFAFGFPLFAPAMYAKLGYGKGDTILAVLAIVIGCPSPFLFWKYGKAVRMRSRHTMKPAVS
ncbi:MFS polyamine transporter [Hymenopellis radicata]|nr:MFS polyamine transporter [Hymenopellis radicata]